MYVFYKYSQTKSGGGVMTNINCTSTCVYQKDGKCHLDNVTTVSNTLNQSCVYFTEKEEKKEKE